MWGYSLKFSPEKKALYGRYFQLRFLRWPAKNGMMFLEETTGGNSMFGRILGAIFLIAKNDPNDWFGGSKAGLKH
jgi:hypothetical protein